MHLLGDHSKIGSCKKVLLLLEKFEISGTCIEYGTACVWAGRKELKMKLKSLYLKDFRGIHDLNLDLDGKSTVLFGINGAGKTTVLSAVNLLYANIINRIVKQRFKQSINMGLSDIKCGKASAQVGADFIFEDSDEVYNYYRRIYYDNKKVTSLQKLDRLVEHYEELYIGKTLIDEENNLIYPDENYDIPVFVNYGVNRLVLKTPLRIRKGEPFTQFSTYERAIESQSAFGRLFEWFLEQEMYEIHRQKEEPDYVDKELKAVKTSMLAMLDGYEDIHIKTRPYSMQIKKGNDQLDILQLSDGEKCIIALFGDLARRLALANPSLDNPLEGTGVVLIDEIELHMHALWQRKVIGVLKKTFPNVQFLITTHSPQVLGEVNEEFKVFSLSRDEDGVQCSALQTLFGLDANTVLEDILGTDSRSREIKEYADKMYSCIEEKEYEKAEVFADLIDEMTLNRNPDTVRARIMIARGKRRNAQN